MAPMHLLTEQADSRLPDRDVKSSNILLTRDNVAKVADVGLATMTDYFSSSSNAHGTFLYAAPEVLMGKPSTAKVRALGLRTACSTHAGICRLKLLSLAVLRPL